MEEKLHRRWVKIGGKKGSIFNGKLHSNLWNETYQKEILQDVVYIGRSLGPFVKDLPRLRYEYRETRRGDTIPIDDEERVSILENFIEVFENNELDSVLTSSLKFILEADGCLEIV